MIDLDPFYPFTPYEDMNKGYTIVLTKSIDQPPYHIDEFCRFAPQKHRRMSLGEMQATFSETIIYLLDHGYTITFKSNHQELDYALSVKVSFFEFNELRIINIKDLIEVPLIQYTNTFKDYFIDFILSHMELTQSFRRPLSTIFETNYPDK